jgi:hypothetical protein
MTSRSHFLIALVGAMTACVTLVSAQPAGDPACATP